MVNIYEELRLKAAAEFDEFCRNESVDEALGETLSNSSDETDYGAWSEGSKQFVHDNYDVLKEYMGDYELSE